MTQSESGNAPREVDLFVKTFAHIGGAVIESSSDLWLKVVDAIFDESKVF